jgi:Kef-type K+ transport system membrane component KefB
MESAASPHLILGILLLSGFILGLAATRLGLPRVGAYVTAGILFSPDLLGGTLGIEVGEWAEGLTTACLGFIAYIIGGAVTVGQLKRLGRTIFFTLGGETLGASLFVFAAIMLIAPGRIAGIEGLHLALAFAAIAATTAPAATLAVIHQYRTRGPMTTTLLSLVALDDAVGLILFALMAVAVSGASLAGSLWSGLAEIAGSIAAGAFFGYLLSFLAGRIHQEILRLPCIVSVVLLCLGTAEHFSLSALLAVMSLGFFTRAFHRASGESLFAPVENLEELVFIVFFTLAGAHFAAGVLFAHLDLVVLYFLARLAGKIAGASIGARLGGAPATVATWIGLGLAPQAGVAVGLSLRLAQQPAFREGGQIVVNVILGTTVLYEIVGPLLARHALLRAGEIGVKRTKDKA